MSTRLIASYELFFRKQKNHFSPSLLHPAASRIQHAKFLVFSLIHHMLILVIPKRKGVAELFGFIEGRWYFSVDAVEMKPSSRTNLMSVDESLRKDWLV